MMYPYITFADETEIVHSNIIADDDEIKKVIVHFERPCEDGFCVARFELPNYTLIKKEHFSDKEIEFFKEFLQNNAHLIYKYAESGGVKIA